MATNVAIAPTAAAGERDSHDKMLEKVALKPFRAAFAKDEEMLSLLQSLDTNNDGFLDREELKLALSKMREGEQLLKKLRKDLKRERRFFVLGIIVAVVIICVKTGLVVLLSKEIKADERTREIPLILITASVMKQEREAARAAGVDKFIEKPFDIVMLRNLVDSITTSA